jgi:cell division protein FtsB
MMKKQKESKIFLTILVLSLLIISIFLFFSSWKIVQKRKELLTKIDNLKQEIEILEKKNQQLKQGIVQTEELNYWEEKIREQGFRKPGETLVVVKPSEAVGQSKQSSSPGFWQRFLDEALGIFK